MMIRTPGDGHWKMMISIRKERDFRNWDHEPNNKGGSELCVYMNFIGNWMDYSCDSLKRFVCYDGKTFQLK